MNVMKMPLPPLSDDLLRASMRWLDLRWDAKRQFITFYGAGHRGDHLVRETIYYALGLLERNEGDDRLTAAAAIQSVLRSQWNAPGTVYHGTWRRTPDEPTPGESPIEWRDYDPNWREFIGTALILILDRHERALPPSLVQAIDAAVKRAVLGTLSRTVPATYSNIALMRAFLLDAAGDRFGEWNWCQQGLNLGREIHALFERTNAFEEYNSPTYYGVDFAALAMWRSFASASELRTRGAAMEAALWKDAARYYHAGLRNYAGPYDRSYGMDLTRYAGLIGLWHWLAVGRDAAPVPSLSAPFDHEWDLGAAPLYAVLGTSVPDDVVAHLKQFAGERLVSQVITSDPKRIATAWLGETVMLGGETGGGASRSYEQFHPVTLHWKKPDGTIGWARLRYRGSVDAEVKTGRLQATLSGEPREFDVEFDPATIRSAKLSAQQWQLDGAAVRIAVLPACSASIDATKNLLRYRVESPGPIDVRWNVSSL
jgi:hypothetical protein